MSKVQGSHSFEVQVGLSGTFVEGYPDSGPTYSSGGEQGQPDGFEDVDVVSLGGLRRDPNAASLAWVAVDLLKGVDRKSDAFKQIVENIIEFIGEDDATVALRYGQEPVKLAVAA